MADTDSGDSKVTGKGLSGIFKKHKGLVIGAMVIILVLMYYFMHNNSSSTSPGTGAGAQTATGDNQVNPDGSGLDSLGDVGDLIGPQGPAGAAGKRGKTGKRGPRGKRGPAPKKKTHPKGRPVVVRRASHPAAASKHG